MTLNRDIILLTGNEESISISEFIAGWGIPYSIIAERLRQNGFPVTRKLINEILNKEHLNQYEKAIIIEIKKLIYIDFKKITL